jgi:hypothetical protein
MYGIQFSSSMVIFISQIKWSLRLRTPRGPAHVKEGISSFDCDTDEAVYSKSFFIAWLTSIVAVISWLPIQLRINDMEVFNPITRSSWRLISLGHPSPFGLSFGPAGGL